MARKSVKPAESLLKSILQSEGFKEIIKLLEVNHPIRTGLGPAATTEQRALKQIQTQEYESILLMLKRWALTGQYQQLESTYEEPNDK